MDKTDILKKLFSKKTKDYTYAIIFFLIFSFFIVFVIKPNVVAILEANRKIEELTVTDSFYEEQILKIVNIQSLLEANRTDLSLLDEAFSRSPQVNKVLSDVGASATDAQASIEKINIEDINLKDIAPASQLRSMEIGVDLKGNFISSLLFIQSLYGQRRLKSLKEVAIERADRDIIGQQEATPSAANQLKIRLKIDGYYL